jgi:serine/threonine protein kinase
VNEWRFFGERTEAGLTYLLGSKLGEKAVYRWEPVVVPLRGFEVNQFRQTLEKRAKILEVCQDQGILRVLGPIEHENRYWIGWKNHRGSNPLTDSSRKNDPTTVIPGLLPPIHAYEAAHQGGLKLGIPDWNRLVWDETGLHLPDPWIKNYLADPGLELIPGLASVYPPEYFSGAESSGQTSDLFSLGVLLYSVICGKLPYPLKNQWPTQGIIRGKTIPLTVECPEVNPEFNQIVLKLLSPEQTNRPAAREVRLRWEQVIAANRCLATAPEYDSNRRKNNRYYLRSLLSKTGAKLKNPALAAIAVIWLIWGCHWYLSRPSPPVTQVVQAIFCTLPDSLPSNVSGSRYLLEKLSAEKRRRILSLNELVNQPYFKLKSIRVLSQTSQKSVLRLNLEWRTWNQGVWNRYQSITTVELKKYRNSWKISKIR